MKRSSTDPSQGPNNKRSHRDASVRMNNDVSRVPSLFDLSAMAVASHLPFEYVENKLTEVPEHIQERIIYFSFPRDSYCIKAYSSLKPRKCDSSEKSAFAIGDQLFKKDCVDNVIQIGKFKNVNNLIYLFSGFHLTGTVKSDYTTGLINVGSYQVSLTFDR